MRTRYIMAVSLAVLALTLGLIGAVPVTAQGATDYWPTNGWRRSTPEQRGMDSTQLAKMVDYLTNQRKYTIHSLLIIRNGTIVADVYFYPFKQGEKHDLASVTKSITSTLVGVAIQQGYIASVRLPVLSFFPGRMIANLDANKNAMTIEDLLTMRAGFECARSSPTPELTLTQMTQSQNYVQFALDLPMADAPGKQFVYCSPGPHLLQAVIQAATGQPTLDFATKSLFTPLGISDFIWPLDPQGIVHGWGDMRMTPYDMAKIGLLYLRQGQWENQQLLPTDWVSAATSLGQGADSRTYGYLWWLSSRSYSAIGRGGQYIIVVPDKNLIVVMTGGGFIGTDSAEWLIPSYILPAAQFATPAPDNPEGKALLDAKIKQAAQPPQAKPEPVAPLPATAQKIAGKQYVMEANPFGILTVSLTFPQPDQARLDVTTDGGISGDKAFQWLAGLDNVDRFAPGRFGLTAAARGKWETDRAFSMRVDEIGNNFIWQIRMLFEGDAVSFKIEDMTRFFPSAAIISGRAQ